jgi:hypothetical protein
MVFPRASPCEILLRCGDIIEEGDGPVWPGNASPASLLFLTHILLQQADNESRYLDRDNNGRTYQKDTRQG